MVATAAGCSPNRCPCASAEVCFDRRATGVLLVRVATFAGRANTGHGAANRAGGPWPPPPPTRNDAKFAAHWTRARAARRPGRRVRPPGDAVEVPLRLGVFRPRHRRARPKVPLLMTAGMGKPGPSRSVRGLLRR